MKAGLAGVLICNLLAPWQIRADELAEAPPLPEVKRHPGAPYKEDFSSWQGIDRSGGTDLFDPIKFIPLTRDESIWVKFGGQARLRYEHFSNFGFGPANDAGYLLTRLRMHSDLHLGEHVRLFAEGKSAFATDRDLPGGRRPLDVDELDLQNLFLDLTLPITSGTSMTLRPGRQELLFGKQRLVSPLEWSNARRTWDGVSAAVTLCQWTVVPFWTQYVPVQKYSFNEADAQNQFFGVYANGPIVENLSADGYFLGQIRDMAATPGGGYNGTFGDEQRYTVGGRLWGLIPATLFDYDVEGAFQFGSVGDGDVRAFMVASELGYSFSEVPTGPRVFAGFDYASGDEGVGGDVQTFNQLFPLGHAYNGFIDAIGRQNLMDTTFGVTFKPLAKLSVKVQQHFFWRADSHDAVYNAGGGVLRPGGVSDETYIGTETDLLVAYTFDPHTTGIAGYSHFFAGDFITDGTPAASDDIDFFYLGVQFDF